MELSHRLVDHGSSWAKAAGDVAALPKAAATPHVTDSGAMEVHMGSPSSRPYSNELRNGNIQKQIVRKSHQYILFI